MKDEVIPKEKWEFNEEVTAVFSDMLSRSIPQYEAMRELVKRIGFNYVIPSTCIMDIGCSNGIAIEPFLDKFGAINNYKLYDVSEPMLAECREKYKGWIKNHLMEVSNFDLRQEIPRTNSSLVLSVLTLQFVPIEYRQKIVKGIYNTLTEGGAFILVEKVLGNTYDIDKTLVDEYYKIKSENSYTQEQIQTKRKSLEGVLVPITAKWNEQLLAEAGFKEVDCFWRCLNFAGWVAIK
jgi:tRNA (cmo5U34)-methyltransferase